MLQSTIDKFTPTKSSRSKDNQSPPWLSNKLKRMIKRRDKLSRKAVKSGDDNIFNLLKATRKNVINLLFQEYNNYIKSINGNVKEAPKNFYTFINSRRHKHIVYASLA